MGNGKFTGVAVVETAEMEVVVLEAAVHLFKENFYSKFFSLFNKKNTMKSFLLREWFKLLVSFSLLIFSFAFLIMIRNSNNSVSVSFPPVSEINHDIYYEGDKIPVYPKQLIWRMLYFIQSAMEHQAEIF